MSILFEAYPDLETLSETAARRFVALARIAIEERGTFAVALAGGSTPRRMYELLSSVHRDDVAWERVEVYFGDERCVARSDALSNYATAHAGLLTRVPVSDEQAHPMFDAGQTPATAADAYDALLAKRFPESRTFDLLFLGAGEDGHTASLFPGAATTSERERRAVAVQAPATSPVRDRITVTLPVIRAARTVLFLVTGASKRWVVESARRVATAELPEGADSPELPPAARAFAADETVWMLDGAAAGMGAGGGGRDAGA